MVKQCSIMYLQIELFYVVLVVQETLEEELAHIVKKHTQTKGEKNSQT